MSRLKLIPVTDKNYSVLLNLLQFYLYDFSVYFCEDDDGYVTENGLFDIGFTMSRYIHSPHKGSRYWATLARVGNRWAGFALVSDRIDAESADPAYTGPGRNMDEFFVMRCFRRQGLGREFATRLFDSYRGYWQVGQIAPNTSAQAFWRTVISAYTSGRYTDFTAQEYTETIVWQTFDSSTW